MVELIVYLPAERNLEKFHLVYNEEINEEAA